jgi:dethiobiotin synthetase
MSRRVPGLFITGTDTGVGKTYIAALIARALVAEGHKVGVYKPAASGCEKHGGVLVSDDAVSLWEAAGRPGDLDHVCPQRFAAPLAPHLAARAEGRELDAELMLRGIEFWQERSDIILVEGAGGLMSPMGDNLYVADLAAAFALPLIVVSRNVLGTINQTLQTLIAASTFRDGLPVAGIVLNHPVPPSSDDVSLSQNRRELTARCIPPILAEVPWSATRMDPAVDWFSLAGSPIKSLIEEDLATERERRFQLEQFGKRASWDDPKMDVYNDLDPRRKS